MDAQWMRAFHEMGNRERRIDAVIHGWGYAVPGTGYSTKDASSRPWLGLRRPLIHSRNYEAILGAAHLSRWSLVARAEMRWQLQIQIIQSTDTNSTFWNSFPNNDARILSRWPQKVPVLIQPPVRDFNGTRYQRKKFSQDLELSKLTCRALTWPFAYVQGQTVRASAWK